VFQGAPLRGCQFTFACDGALARAPRGEAWQGALALAGQALDGLVEPSVGASTHYHTLAVHPLWDVTMQPTRRIGDHQFYRFHGRLGESAVLDGQYAGVEPERPFATPILAVSTHQPRAAHPGAAAFAVWGLPLATVSARGGAIVVAATPATLER
jgi:hypothetical protein